MTTASLIEIKKGECFMHFLRPSFMRMFSISFFICSLVFFKNGNAEEFVWEDQIYDNETVTKLITVIISTSPIPSMPSTEFLYQSQSSLFINPILAQCKKIIVFDGISPDHAHLQQNYEEYKNNVQQLTQIDPYFENTQLIFCEQWGHLSGSIKTAIEHVDTPFIFMFQHDLVLVKDFNLNGIIATIVNNPLIKQVELDSTGWGNDAHPWYAPVDSFIEGIHFIPLSRSFGWSDRAHITTVNHYKNFVLPQCHHGFMENFLHPALKNAIASKGLTAGHRPFGTYLYGDLKDGGYVIHTDGRYRLTIN
jgi:hypothetical protein